ncbi:integral inner membrane protein of type IV secretion complex (VirB6) [Hydrogenophaga taeniospiralis CCUG 15921]|uniref:Integral inner membrane protein of type IV secretion complex (VirB6) n=1 Tax=Hydrogenophaga taeniospiralis CCUG 15921 TaxID=1281780 RepID=A0A9X4P1L9_9BURK|nr:type IV secretion system protein [Hydrogenophaga taeniospiralis]MDG5974383.1 integral inner membrane protein of type IV secretion complex (VirB6) [Hydrogenophaga taeniospiralis CCUG 15921]
MTCGDAAVPGFLLAALGMLDPKYIKMIDDAVFMCSIREYLIDDMLIGTYRELVASRLGTALAYLSTAIMTAWVLVQGFTLISGTNRQPVLGLAFKTGKMVFILSLVTLLATKSPVIADTVLDVQALITAAIVGEGTDVYQIIDFNLALAQVFNALVNSLVGGQQVGAQGNALTSLSGMIGQSGPAMLVSVLAMMAEISITLAVMLSPLFIFFLLFQQTASMFWSWAKFLLGTMVSLAVLALLSGVLLKMTMFYGGSVLAAFYINGALGDAGTIDMANSALRMSVMGVLSSMLVMLVPPLIMQFFNSGASFAAGAMTGAMAGGGAMAAHGSPSAGLAGALGAMQNGPPALGNGTPGGAPGGRDAHNEAGGHGNFAAANNQELLARSRNLAGPDAEAGGGARRGAVLGQGLRGLANQSSDAMALAGLQQRQSTNEFRGGASGGWSGSNRVSSADAIEDAVIRDPALGSGGHLGVHGGGGGARATAQAPTESTAAPVGHPSTASGPATTTPVHATPPTRAQHANQASPQRPNIRHAPSVGAVRRP